MTLYSYQSYLDFVLTSAEVIRMQSLILRTCMQGALFNQSAEAAFPIPVVFDTTNFIFGAAIGDAFAIIKVKLLEGWTLFDYTNLS